MYNATDHFQATYHAFSPEFRFQAKTLEDLQQWQAAFRPRLRTILGLDNLEADLKDHVPTATLQLRHGLLAGRTPIGERVWDMSRLIDWALANLEVNPDKIAMTGNSGGGPSPSSLPRARPVYRSPCRGVISAHSKAASVPLITATVTMSPVFYDLAKCTMSPV